jgi:hypothetical protein
MKPRKPARRPSPAKVTYDTVRRLAADLPGVEEGTSYGTAALKVRGKLFARLREDGETLVLRMDFVNRDLLLAAEPDVFHVTDHYRDYPWILIRLKSVLRDQMRELLEDAWRRTAPKRMVREYDAQP